VFDRLVEAVRDLTAYTASREAEGHWLVEHCINPTEEARETYLGVIDERIEQALDELTARRGVCSVTARRTARTSGSRSRSVARTDFTSSGGASA
jgi:hypothetical protein